MPIRRVHRLSLTLFASLALANKIRPALLPCTRRLEHPRCPWCVFILTAFFRVLISFSSLLFSFSTPALATFATLVVFVSIRPAFLYTLAAAIKFSTLSCNTSNFQSSIRQFLNLVFGQDSQYNDTIKSFLKAFLSLFEGLRIDQPSIDFGPSSSCGNAFLGRLPVKPRKSTVFLAHHHDNIPLSGARLLLVQD